MFVVEGFTSERVKGIAAHLVAKQQCDGDRGLPLRQQDPARGSVSQQSLDLRPAADHIAHAGVAKQPPRPRDVQEQEPGRLSPGAPHPQGPPAGVQGEHAVRLVVRPHPGDMWVLACWC